MNKMRFSIISLLAILFMMAGCSGNGQGEVGEKMTPVELGKAIAANYVEVMNKVINLLKDTPPGIEVKPKLEELKETYVQKFVAFGKQRETLSAADKATTDSQISMGISKIPMATYNRYTEIQKHYMGSDTGMANLIASFNIITQYASFELLKKQEPEEAKRLGIE
jgi:hypothetical protein